MKKKIGFVLPKLCIGVGIGLLGLSIVLLAVWRWNISHSAKQAEHYVHTLQALLPSPETAVLEERRENTMSVLSIDGIDFVGLIELPQYESVLPVSAEWGKTSRYPCRFSGSIYDGTLQIGATMQKGQYDFYRELSVGDTVLYTDMEGNRYSLEITSLNYAKHADQAALQREDAVLTLFIQPIYSFEYLIVFCNVPT